MSDRQQILEQVQKLNQDPLNQAALQRLLQDGNAQDPMLMHLLDLTYAPLSKHEPLEHDSAEGKVLMDWSAEPRIQASALEQMRDDLEPEEVLSLPLQEIARVI